MPGPVQLYSVRPPNGAAELRGDMEPSRVMTLFWSQSKMPGGLMMDLGSITAKKKLMTLSHPL
jgi:hypothetical protein